MQFHTVNPLCLGLRVVNVPHKTETCAPDLSDLDSLAWFHQPVAHLQRWGRHPMSVDLIVLGDKLTAIYFPLSHDVLSVVGSYIIPENDLLVNLITYFIKNEITNQVIKIVVSWVGLTILNPV